MNPAAQERFATLANVPLQPAGPQPGFFTGTARSARDLWAYRELLGLLIRRELKARYKDSLLGFVWTLMRPLTMLFVYYVAIGKFLNGEDNIPGFAIFIFSGLTAWALFSEILSGATSSIVGNGGLVKKVYLPREVFPLAVTGAAIVNFTVQLGILILATLVLQQIPTWPSVLYAPLSIAILLVFALALGFVMSAVNVYLRDVQYLIEIVLMVLMWASPIVYSWALVDNALGDSIWGKLYLANPVTLAVLGFQQAFWVQGADQPVPSDLPLRMFIALAVGLVLLWLSQRVFARLEGNFAQEL